MGPAAAELIAPVTNRWPAGQGEMAARIRGFDWARTPLGSIDSWPERLRGFVDLVLLSRQPMFVVAGPDLILIYNDAYKVFLSGKHPQALGSPFRQVFAEVLDALAPMLQRTLAGQQEIMLNRHFVLPWRIDAPEGWFEATWTPVPDEQGVISGFVAAITETTDRSRAHTVLRRSESRQALLLNLSDALRPLSDPVDIEIEAVRVLGKHLGVTRAQYYKVDPYGEHAEASVVFSDGAPPVTGRIRLDDFGAHIRKTYAAGRPVVFDDASTDPRLSETQRRLYQSRSALAAIGVPLLRNGRLVAVLGVSSATPRNWTEGEVELVEEVAERTWAAVERARAEAALREREADLARVQRIGGVGGINIDVVNGLRGWRSPEYLRLHGLPADKTIETHEEWLARIVPEDRDQADAALFTALNAQSPTYENEYRIVRPSDGTVRWIFARADIERDPSGKPLRVVGAHIDITDRKQTEEALRQSEHRLRLALEAGRMGIWSFDIRTGRQEWSDGQFEIFGLSPGGQPPTRAEFLKLVHPDDLHLVEFTENDTRPEGTALDSEFRIVRPNGEVRWISAHSLARFGHGGRPVELIGVNYDVTERRRQEDALRTSEERLREFGEASSDVLWIRDADTMQWEYLSPAFDRIYGISRQDALRGDNYRSWMDLIVEEDRERAAASIGKVRLGQRAPFEYRIRRPVDGELRWLRSTSFPMRDETGKVRRIGGVGHDITALRAAEEHQRILLAELQHRVRNTLSVIRSIARRTAESSESVEEYAMHLDGRISAFSRVQSAVTRNPAAGIELGGIVLDELSAHGARQGSQVDVQGPQVHLTAKAAETLGLTIHELATNAVKHGALSLPRGEVKVTWRREDAEGGRESLVLVWQESGLPGGKIVPKRHGFGTELLERTLAHEFKAEVSQVFQKGGLHCSIRLPATAKLLADFHG